MVGSPIVWPDCKPRLKHRIEGWQQRNCPSRDPVLASWVGWPARRPPPLVPRGLRPRMPQIALRTRAVATFATDLWTSALRRQPDVDLRSGASNLPMEICGSRGGGLCAEWEAGTDDERGTCVRLGWTHLPSIGGPSVQRKRSSGRLLPEWLAEIANNLPCAPLADSRYHGCSFGGCGRLVAPQTCATPSDQGDAPSCRLPSQGQVGTTGEETDA
jgi:hypothetical protein